MSELGPTLDDLPARLDVGHARANLYAAARDGLGARLTWLDGEELLAQPLLLDRLLPLAQAGLDRAGVVRADSTHYLGIVEGRVRSLRTGARWMTRSLTAMQDRGGAGARATALVAAMIARQKTGQVVSEWEPAQLVENDSARTGHHRVGQHMTTDLVTLRPDDPVELAAELMSWRRIRHLPVEDEAGRLVGLVSLRGVQRHLAEQAGSRTAAGAPGAPVSDVMKRSLITVTPEAPVLMAIHLMRRNRIGCLPVKQGDHLVAILTEEDLVEFADELREQDAAARSGNGGGRSAEE
jgi:CBS domain-containing protein